MLGWRIFVWRAQCDQSGAPPKELVFLGLRNSLFQRQDGLAKLAQVSLIPWKMWVDNRQELCYISWKGFKYHLLPMKNFVNYLLFSSIVGMKDCQENPWKMINWKKKSEGYLLLNWGDISYTLAIANLSQYQRKKKRCHEGCFRT